MSLTSKIQHKDYETGEFSDIKERSFQEIAELVKTFPWDAERTLTDIQLTGPSVTIESGRGEYLKLGLYFNGKFCLYFYNNEHQLFELIEPNLADALVIIKSFYDGVMTMDGFTKHLISFNNKKHFETNYFEYTVNQLRLWAFAGWPIATTIFFLTICTAGYSAAAPPPLLLLGCFFLVVSCGFLYLILNYYNHDKGLCLQISKGQDVFHFGTIEEPVEYHKADIIAINYLTPKRSKGRDSNMAIFEILLKNGDQLTFSNLLIKRDTFLDKFNDVNICRMDNWFPTFKS